MTKEIVEAEDLKLLAVVGTYGYQCTCCETQAFPQSYRPENEPFAQLPNQPIALFFQLDQPLLCGEGPLLADSCLIRKAQSGQKRSLLASGNRPLHSQENYSGVSMEIKSLATVAMIEYVICYCCSSGTLIPGYGL
ncbi:hypothetical protein [Stutzerimonas xanthomarina]|uniref:hypothetical protein n=1 Tax=Stutzerimonas xanthomarina TaxID=271420 RepID=UPI003AA80E2D